MAKTPETKAKTHIMRVLREVCECTGWVVDVETHAGDSFSTPTLDITGTLSHPLRRGWGIPFAIEVKRFDNKGKLTERQRITMRNKTRAGCAVFLIDSNESLSAFATWIQTGCPTTLPSSTAET
jgi:hypothetical protein